MSKFEAKDYVQVDGQGKQTISSLAYWLTPEGINAFTAELVQEAIDNNNDKEFAKAFDGATKDDAKSFLAKWEMCYMPYWSADELGSAVTISNNARNGATAARATTLAQQAGELQQAFTPRQGIEWAMARGYMIDSEICQLVGVKQGEYGHPHNPLQTQPKLEAPVDPKAKAQKMHLMKSRSPAPLTAEIKTAKENALDADDPSSVWAELIKMAEKRHGCLLGVDEDSIKYQSGETVRHFNKRNLRERMKRNHDK